MEQWKYIEGTEHKYMISNLGNIKSLNYRNTKEEKLLKCYGKKYKMIKLTKHNRRKDCYLHRLVAEAFIPNDKNYPCINHINGNKLDNRAKNLEWCDYKHNIREAFRLGLSKNKTGKGNGRSITVKQYDINNNFIKQWESMNLAEKELGIKHIHECCKNQRKTSGGYIWKIANNIIDE